MRGISPENKQIKNAHTCFKRYTALYCFVKSKRANNGYRTIKVMEKTSKNHDFHTETKSVRKNTFIAVKVTK